MRAVVVESFGGSEVLTSVSIPVPQPGPGEIRVRVAGAAVNPTDILFREGALAARMRTTSRPYVPGMDLAGTVDAIGPGASGRFEVGDRVMAIARPLDRGGAYADFVVVPDASAVTAPRDLDLLQASAILMNALTARLALDEVTPHHVEGPVPGHDVQPDLLLGVTGAIGIVGGLLLQLAQADGHRVIADSTSADADAVRDLGAFEVVPRGPGFSRHVRSLAPAGVAGLVDAALMGSSVLEAVRTGGDLAALREWPGGTERAIRIHQVRVGLSTERTDLLEALRDQVAAGVLTPRVAEVLTADRAGEAHDRLAAGGLRGRIVLDFR